MAPLEHGQVVINLCDDDDDLPPPRKSASTHKAVVNRPKESRPHPNSKVIDLSKSPERDLLSHDRRRDFQSSPQASDASLQVPPRKRAARSSPSSKSPERSNGSTSSRMGIVSKDRTTSKSGLSFKSSSSPNPMADNGFGENLKNQKRARENEDASSDSGRPGKRQRSVHVHSGSAHGSQENPRTPTPGKVPLASTKQTSGDVVDLTSDAEEQISRTTSTPVRPTGTAVNRRREILAIGNGKSGEHASSQRQKAESARESPKKRIGHEAGKLLANNVLSNPRSSPLRKVSRPGVPQRDGSEGTAIDERGLEIPESLPGSPETDKPAEKRGGRDAVRNPGNPRALRESVSPFRAASSAAAGLLSEPHHLGPMTWRKNRALPLTPSESSADEDVRNKERSVKKTASPAKPSSTRVPQSTQSRLDGAHRTASPRQDQSKSVAAQESQPALTPSLNTKNSIPKSQLFNTARESHKVSSTNQSLTNPANNTSKPQGKQGVSQPAEARARLQQNQKTNDTSDSNVTGRSSVLHTPGMSTFKMAERAVGHWLGQLQHDNEYWTRTELQRARHACEGRLSTTPIEPTSVFSKMTPLAVKSNDRKKADKPHAKFEIEIARSVKKSAWTTPYTTFDTDQEDVPSYSHFVMLKHNFLAPNETTLQHWPYFDDETNSRPQLAEQFNTLYSLDITDREKKLLLLMKAEIYAEHAERMLQDVQCEWADVLHFFLDPAPELGDDADAKKALQSRDTASDVKAFRESKRWAAVLSKLPKASPANTGRAGLLCEQFYKLAGLSFWHVVRRSDYTKSLLEEETPEDSLDKLTCRVCMRLSCPYHGEIENPDDDSESDVSSEHSAVEKDIINPKKKNYRTRVELPAVLEEETDSTGKDRRHLHYWHAGGTVANLLHKPDERNPFYPCHHPGLPCNDAQCTCFTNKVACEKSCACSPACTRKFQGCNCAKKGKVCFNTDSCACFNLGRECDPDLCGSCGVCDVLDPKHNHDDRILIDRCRNANIQRGHPKHTMIGKSGVHGFGLYACENIREHELIGEYKGELITVKEAERRGAIYEHQRLSYLFTLNQSQEVDSTFFGNKTRFINHATKAKCNVYARIIMVNTVHRIGMFAERDILAGEELYFDYGPRFTFAEEQASRKRRGGKTSNNSSQSKAVPHVRNANLTKSFYDPEDERGGRAAQKSLGRPPRTDHGRLTAAQLRRGMPSSSSDVEMGEAEDDDTDDYQDEDEDEDDLYS
ncbi:hypothetical protein M409DRAFT_49856 [Zasmidium cellare ATCC 36951]|uniref:SET domain-containing protein n=1 Tax=Zasmidium cellare ATCC 36951 TaxID=1080233 RepID=A0A6A6D1Z5_ZASCE|nr:uncharacterized protein M409DRAFT_49856 [Zasmidium cellare ATCC 36951]KAF2172109.1 hypothetical protein M409DRAFT_49856 [Zasmidium cellare ATCC 36951]